MLHAFLVFALLGLPAFASEQSDKDAAFHKDIEGFTLIKKDNMDLLRQHNWSGKFTVFVGGEKLCDGAIELSYFHPTQSADTLAPEGAEPIDIAYHHTPHIEQCLDQSRFSQIIDKIDTVNTPCDRTRQFRTVHLDDDPAKGRAYSPKCIGDKLVWLPLPIQPTSWVSKDGKTLKSLVNFALPGTPAGLRDKLPEVKVFYDLEPERSGAAPAASSSDHSSAE